MHRTYDQKQHSTALAMFKSIMQNVIKKLDKALKILESKPVIDIDEKMQFRIAIMTVLQCIKMFPSSFKTIVANRQGGVGSKKD